MTTDFSQVLQHIEAMVEAFMERLPNILVGLAVFSLFLTVAPISG